jgi:hypothetical protein
MDAVRWVSFEGRSTSDRRNALLMFDVLSFLRSGNRSWSVEGYVKDGAKGERKKAGAGRWERRVAERLGVKNGQLNQPSLTTRLGPLPKGSFSTANWISLPSVTRSSTGFRDLLWLKPVSGRSDVISGNQDEVCRVCASHFWIFQKSMLYCSSLLRSHRTSKLNT